MLFALPMDNFSQGIRFKHFEEQDGLVDSRVNEIAQDSKGFMWFITNGGISRYDGYTFKNFKHETKDSSSISSGQINSIYVDRDDVLWLGVEGVGLDKYDPRTGQFTHYLYSPENSDGLSSADIRDIVVDKNGQLWLATWGGGLNLFDRELETFAHFRHDAENKYSISSDYINVIVEDTNPQNRALWIGTHKGLNRFDYEQQQFTHFQHDSTNQNSLSWNWINDLHFSSSGDLWIGTSQGLDLFKPEKKQFTHFIKDPNNSNTLSSNNVRSLLEDRSGNLWVGPAERFPMDRISFYESNLSSKTAQISHYRYDEFNPYSLSDYLHIRDIYEDNSGSIWIKPYTGSTNYGGVDRFDPATENFKNYNNIPGNENSIHGNYVTDVYQDPEGVLWINTELGLDVVDRRSGVYNYYKFAPETKDSDLVLILSINPDQTDSDLLWVGTTQGLYDFRMSNGSFNLKVNTGWVRSPSSDRYGNIWFLSDGLHKYNSNDSSIISYSHDPNNEDSPTFKKARRLLLEPGKKDTIIWLGNSKGLLRFDTRRQEFEKYPFDPHETLGREFGKVRSFSMDSLGYMWVFSKNYLHKFDLETGEYTHFKPPEAWDGRGIGDLTIDRDGNIWEGSSSGLWRFKPRKEEFKQFTHHDGLTGAGMSMLFYNNQTGEMFAGGDYGLNSFFPDQIKENINIPPVVFTDFKKFNQSVKLDTSIEWISHITLEPDENVFSFEFAALNFVNSQKNQYAYKMEGFDGAWIKTDASNRVANYTNLDPGDYTFRVKGSNNDGLWNEKGTSIRVTILPHWWESNLAYFIYFILFLTALYRYRVFELKRVKLQQNYDMERFEANKLKEMDQLKSRFFANISHEFRTPLTLILGPIGKMLNRVVDSDSQQELNLMQRQAKHLLELVSQLLDLSKLEAGKMAIQVSKRNIVPLLKGLSLSFASLAEQEKKTLSFENELEDIQIYVNKEAITKILNNLLSNAFKFTTSGGLVNILVKVHSESEPFPEGSIEISILDDGIGIPAKRVDQVFDRFYQVDNSETREREGTGIGLALTRELVELHHGSIEVSSIEGRGTTFSIQLPLGRKHLKPEEIIESDFGDDSVEQIPIEGEISLSPQTRIDDSTPILLIVEDNPDVRNYIKSDLVDHYNCYEAVDGEAGLELAQELIPDLIISDVMMPKMDGVEFCGKIKSNELTSHIPVILLTAKADLASKLEGLETGADDYLTKPFESDELQIRIKNLIHQRELLRASFQKDMSLVPEGLNLSSMDEQFLEKASQISRDHIGDFQFNVDAFARKIFMSRQHLNRKLKALTGSTAIEFIRTIRLKSAAILLQNQQSTIAEIAYQVGYTNASHFAKAFQAEFGSSPSEYQVQHKAGEK